MHAGRGGKSVRNEGENMKELLGAKTQEYQAKAREVAEKYVRPVAAELDRTGEYPWSVIAALKEYDLMGIWVPKEYGGHGAGVLDMCVVVEQLSRACGGVGVAYAVNALGSFPIVLGGTEEQKRRYLPAITTGEKLIAFGLSEKASGSDAGSLRARAVKDGDGYVIDGDKKWTTNANAASIYTVYASTNPDRGTRGASAFIVEKDTPGFEIGKREQLMGIRCVPVHELHFHGCRVPASALLGDKEGAGFANAMRVTTDAVQLFGGYGYCQDYPIEKYMRDAKITQIYEGTNQIQRVVIGRSLTREAGAMAGHLNVKVEHFPKP